MPAHAQRMRSLLAADREFAGPNMLFMFVTRDVSQLRGWLKASSACAEGRKHRLARPSVRGELCARAGGREAVCGTADWGGTGYGRVIRKTSSSCP